MSWSDNTSPTSTLSIGVRLAAHGSQISTVCLKCHFLTSHPCSWRSYYLFEQRRLVLYDDGRSIATGSNRGIVLLSETCYSASRQVGCPIHRHKGRSKNFSPRDSLRYSWLATLTSYFAGTVLLYYALIAGDWTLSVYRREQCQSAHCIIVVSIAS